MIKLIFQSALQRDSKVILLLIQFTIGFVALLIGLSSMFHQIEYRKKVETLAPLNAVHFYMDPEVSTDPEDTDIVIKYREVFKEIKEEGLVERLGLFETMYFHENSKSVDFNYQFYILNEDLLEITDYKLEEGSVEPLKNYKKSQEIVPVLVSSALKNDYKIGETYQLYLNGSETGNVEIKVVGILEPSFHFWIGGGSQISNALLDNNKFILAPQFKEFESFITYQNNSLILLGNEENLEREVILKKIQQLFEKYNLSFLYSEIQDEVNLYYESVKPVIIVTTLFATILLILSLFGCIGAMLANITTRYKEFGIYYALGFTKNHIARLVYGEITAIFILSFIFAVIICKVPLANLLEEGEFMMNFAVIITAFLMMILCIIFTSIFPFMKLRKLEPIEMIRGAN